MNYQPFFAIYTEGSPNFQKNQTYPKTTSSARAEAKRFDGFP
jgi:hypothetical protein